MYVQHQLQPTFPPRKINWQEYAHRLHLTVALLTA